MIFDIGTPQNVTCKWLKEHGYSRINWGSPDYYIPWEKMPARLGIYERRSNARWRQRSFAWEKIITLRNGDTRDIVFFPKTFTKYVNMESSTVNYPKNAIMVVEDCGVLTTTNHLFENVRKIQDVLSVEILAQQKHIKQ